jgi:transforming growth factor-beta-induced protein
MKKLLVTLIASISMLSAVVKATPTSTKNIAEIAVGSGKFKTLVAALTAADLVGAVAGPGPLTVFAPTDAAFAKLPAGTVESLLSDIPTLTKILTYHVAAGLKSPRNLLNEKLVTTLQGGKVKVQVYQGRLFINKSQVIMKPIRASNGVIYVIDAVLLP